MDSEFLIISKEAIRQLGVNQAVVLGFFMDKWQKCEQAEFYYSMQDLAKNTGLSDFECKNITQELLNKCFLIKGKRGGFYNINQNPN